MCSAPTGSSAESFGFDALLVRIGCLSDIPPLHGEVYPIDAIEIPEAFDGKLAGRDPGPGAGQRSVRYPVSYTHLDVYKRQGLGRVEIIVHRLTEAARVRFLPVNREKIGIDCLQRDIQASQRLPSVVEMTIGIIERTTVVGAQDEDCLLYTSRCV